MSLRFAVDTGGTFTDLVVEDETGGVAMFKAPTTPADPPEGILNCLRLAAEARNTDLQTLLGEGDLFIHGTTHAINAIVTGRTARTAFLTTEGHPDVLVIREGGRTEPFNYAVKRADPYVPRALTFEVPGRIDSNGSVYKDLDRDAVVAIAGELAERKIEAIGVCLLWSIVNPAHELAVGKILEEKLPGVPYTLSHQINPILREFRRASSTVIDASLKPLMSRYLAGLTERLESSGYRGRLLILTSKGGMMDAAELARQPIHAINSGPSMAPIAGRYYARPQKSPRDVIIADTGGTTYDVSLVRDGRIPHTAETWIGPKFQGHMTGFPSVDVKSVGAGGGSIAWVDKGGMLHVGPQSAGADPGPACYGTGGREPTLTDACLTLGYLDPEFFLGGKYKLDQSAAHDAIRKVVAEPLGMDLETAAWNVVRVATENMVSAINNITVNQGVDPAAADLIGGGGAAGLNSVFIARRLGCKRLLLPDLGAALSAVGALISDLTTEFRKTFLTTASRFDLDTVNRILAELERRCSEFSGTAGRNAASSSNSFAVEARYEGQVWEIEVPLRSARLNGPSDVSRLVDDFHAMHKRINSIDDRESEVEFVGWKALVRCALREEAQLGRPDEQHVAVPPIRKRRAWFEGEGWASVAVHLLSKLDGSLLEGPALVESPFTTIVLPAGTRFRHTDERLIVNTTI